jgi:hypothetical protein
MITFPPAFIVMLVILAALFIYYLRKPSDVAAGAAVVADAGVRGAVSVGRGLRSIMVLLFAAAVIFLIGGNWVVSIIFAAPVAIWLASIVIRD